MKCLSASDAVDGFSTGTRVDACAAAGVVALGGPSYTRDDSQIAL